MLLSIARLYFAKGYIWWVGICWYTISANKNDDETIAEYHQT